MWIDDIKSPAGMSWEERRDYMRNGSFEGSAEAEKAERKLIREHFRPSQKKADDFVWLLGPDVPSTPHNQEGQADG